MKISGLAKSVTAINLLVLLSACNNENTATNSSKPDSTVQQKTDTKDVKACNLLTESDAKSILGNAIQPGMQTETMCQYVSAAEELSKTGENVSVTYHQNAGSEFDKYIADTETSTGVKPEPLEGIGDRAAWAEGSLIVKKSSDLLVIIVGKKMEKEAHIAEARKLAMTILERL